MTTMAAVPLATASHPQKQQRGKEEEENGGARVGGEAPGEEFGSSRNEGLDWDLTKHLLKSFRTLT